MSPICVSLNSFRDLLTATGFPLPTASGHHRAPAWNLYTTCHVYLFDPINSFLSQILCLLEMPWLIFYSFLMLFRIYLFYNFHAHPTCF